jgi:hypothetical protein
MSLKTASILIIDDDVDVLTAVRSIIKTGSERNRLQRKTRRIFVHFEQAGGLM